MGREERKWKKHLEQREQTERRKLAKHKPLKARKGDETATEKGLVVERGASTCLIRTESGNLRCQCLLDAATGDRVLFSASRRKVEKVLPRSTVLSRPDPHNNRIELVIAANIDIVAHVVSLKEPPLRVGLIDRYLIAIEQSGAKPLICVNKIDLLTPDDHVDDDLRPYEQLGVPVVRCSASLGTGLDELRALLAGKLCVFTGHSGVGKSSLLNALDPLSEAATGDVSQANRKGRHTTTSSKLYDLPNGAMIIDTPGIREFGLWNLTPGQARLYFHEFDAFAPGCAFADCTHTHEPRCAVIEALEAGAIPRARYDAYRRILL